MTCKHPSHVPWEGLARPEEPYFEGHAWKNSMVDNLCLNGNCLLNGEVHGEKCKEYLGRDKLQHNPTVTSRFQKNPIATSSKNTELIPFYYRQ